MAPAVGFELPRPSADFTDGCALDVLIPQASKFDIRASLDRKSTHSIGDQLQTIPQRKVLFFDETVDLYLVLFVSRVEKSQIKAYLSRLILNVEVAAATRFTSSAKPGEQIRQEHGARDVLQTISLEGSSDPAFIAHEQKNESDHIVVIWKTSSLLNRPKSRISNPYILVSLSGIIQPIKDDEGVNNSEYMSSQVPIGSNLLQSFKFDPYLGNGNPSLSSVKLLRVVPYEDDQMRVNLPLRNTYQKSFWAIPAVSAMVRLSRLHVYTDRPTITASLEFEVAPVLECEATLETLDLVMLEGTLQSLTPSGAIQLPQTCHPGDKVAFLYRVVPEGVIETNSYHKGNIRIMEITIKVTLHVAADCQPELVMTWRTSVDFSTPLNPSFSDATGSAMHRPQRPANISPNLSGSVMTLGGSSLVGSRPLGIGVDVLHGAEYQRRHRPDSSHELGLTITFSGPENVYVGEVFQWTAFIINHTGRSRKIGLLVLPKRRRDLRRAAHKHQSEEVVEPIDLECPAALDGAEIFSKFRSGVSEPADLVSLSTDVMVGPLAPSACHTVDLKLVAMASGVLLVEAVRVTDLVTQEVVEIRDLPCIVASTPSKAK